MFCAIASGEHEAHRVLETAEVVAFLDRRPVFPGHVLLIPRLHVETLADVPDGLLGPLLAATRALTVAMQRALGADGTFVGQNNVVSQSVPHVHFHVVPRRFKDGLRGFFWPRHPYGSEDEAAEIAARLRAVIVS